MRLDYKIFIQKLESAISWPTIFTRPNTTHFQEILGFPVNIKRS